MIPTTAILENFFSGWSVQRLCDHYALSAEVVEAIIRKHSLDATRSAYAEYVTYPCKEHGRTYREPERRGSRQTTRQSE